MKTEERHWRDIRAEAGRVDPARADAAGKGMNDAVQAQRLADIRKALGHACRADVAAIMGVSQARVSELESGGLSHTKLGTLQSYVAALGGSLARKLNPSLAKFGDDALRWRWSS